MRAPLVLVLLLGACAAARNPERSKLQPAPTPTATPESSAVASNPNAPSPSAAPAPVAPVEATVAPVRETQFELGRVGDEPLTSRDFLRKLWIADNRLARRVVEQLVFSRLTQLEATRLGIRLVESAVDAEVLRAMGELERKLIDRQSKLTLREHIDQVIGIEPELYLADLRDEAILQMLAERCVRAWAVENDRCDVRVTELRSPEALAAAQADLNAGKTFAEVAKAHGNGDDAVTATTLLRITRAESQDLSRAVFATAVGTVGGPLEQGGRWLLFVPEARHEGREGTWVELREEVERSLATQPVGELEFVQWRAAMVRRYRVDLQPFFQEVERKGAAGR
jgi:hypothetical protein